MRHHGAKRGIIVIIRGGGELLLIISMGIDAMSVMSIFKPYMDTAMTRKPGIKVNTYL